MSDTPHSSHRAHRQAAPKRVPIAVITVSDTRDAASDTGGALIEQTLREAGHPCVARDWVRDEPDAIRASLEALLARDDVAAVILTGGTGIAPRDRTPESVEPLFERAIPGFGELFRALSYQEIGSAAMLSRACAGIARGRVVFALPGSRAAISLALAKLILPELPHLAAEATKRVAAGS